MTAADDARRYRVLDVLGRGGFGTVYRAELQGSQGFRKEVALKILNEGIEASTQHLALLRDEARVLGLVRHRSIVAVDALVKLEGRWCVVMEYVRGVTLRQLADAEGALTLAVALQIVEEVASALDAAWTAVDPDGRPLNLVHRDVKPSNVQITPRGEVKLLDFGVARAEFEAREHATRGVIFGSVPYVAPERLEHQDSHAVDVYALGLTLAQLLGGRIPLRGPSSVADHHVRQQEIDDTLGAAGVPDELRQLVRRCTAWDPDERPTARELERTSRRMRGSLPDVSLRDWAEPRVEALLDDVAVGGEFTGMVLTEAGPTDRGIHLSELLGHSVPITFDDLATGDALLEHPPTLASPPPEAPAPDPPATHSSSRRIRSKLATALLAAGLAIAVLVTSLIVATAGGTTLFTSLVVAAVQGTDWCGSEIERSRRLVADRKIKPQRRVIELIDEAERACRMGRLDFWGANAVVLVLDRTSKDGVLDPTELKELEVTIRSRSR